MTSHYTETERAVFDAAIAEFGEHGRDGTRMQEIADRAGITKAMVHYYFRSKERLYEAVFAYLMRTFFRTFGEALCDAEDFPTLLRTFIDKYLDILDTNPLLVRFMAREMTDGAPVFKVAIAAMLAEKQPIPPRIFMEKCSAASKRGDIRPCDPVQTMITLLGSCVFTHIAFPMIQVMSPGIGAHRKKFMQQRKDHLFDILYYGLKPRPEAA